jgi:hypothetical protein
MTTAYTSLLGLALPVTGELSGTWGDTVNNSITSLLDDAIAGTTTLSTDADVTLSNNDGTADTSRQAILLWTAGGTVTRTVIAPAQSKIYTVINASSSTQSIKVTGPGPTTGVTIVKGESALIAWNGSDFVKVSNSGGSFTTQDLTVTGNTILGDAITDTTTLNAQTRFLSLATLGYSNMTGPAATSLSTTAPAFLYSGATTYTVADVSGGTKAHAPIISLGQATIANATTATTFTNASTLYIAGAPSAGTNITITNPYALYVAAGASYLGGNTAVTGTLSATGDLSFSTVGSKVNFATTSSATVNYVGGSADGFSLEMVTQRGALQPLTYKQDYGVGHVWSIAGSTSMTIAGATGGVGAVGIGYTSLTSVGNNGLAVLGNVGIGTSSPSQKLDVFGGTASSAVAQFTGVNTGRGLKISTALVNSVNDAGVILDAQQASGVLMLATGGTERARIDASGNLGLGVTPSTGWAVNNRAIQLLGGYGSISANNSQGTCDVAYNCYNSTAQAVLGWKYTNSSAAATLYQQLNGIHAWHIAPIGTADVGIIFTQAMTLDASGNLLVGANGTGLDTATPLNMSLGSTFSNTAGSASTTKLRVFQDSSSNIYGFGVSNGLLETHVPTSSGFAWYANNVERARITSGGYLSLKYPTWNGPLINSGSGNVVSVASGGTINLTVANAGAVLICVYDTTSGNGGVFFGSYTTTITKIAGDGSATDAGSDIAVYKTANSHTIIFKNRYATTRDFNIGIYSANALP